MENTNIVKYNGKDTFEPLVDLGNAILKVMPDIVLKHGDVVKRYVDETLYPNGAIYTFNVHHKTDINNSIGKLSLLDWNTKTLKYGIQSINIDDGRESWGVDGQVKTSIHAKNIVRVAKKVFKPFTFDQIAKKNYQTFSNKMQWLSHNMQWEMRNATCNDFSIFLDDFYHMKEIGYTPKNPKIQAMIDHVVENKEKINKYLDYNPQHYFVLVKQNEVQYGTKHGAVFDNPTTVPSKDDLPDDIKGKLFVLDITESKDFIEDVGLKENDGAYWVIA